MMTPSSMRMDRIPNSPSLPTALGTTTSMLSWTLCATTMTSRRPRPGLATTLREISGSRFRLRRVKRILPRPRPRTRRRQPRHRLRLRARKRKPKKRPKPRLLQKARLLLKTKARKRHSRASTRLSARQKRRERRKRARSQKRPRVARARRERRMTKRVSVMASTCAETLLKARASTLQHWSHTPRSSWTKLITTTSTVC